MKNALIVIVVLAVIGGGAFALTKKSDDNKESKPATTQSQPKEPTKTEEKPATTEQSSTNTITYGDNGFSPSTLTVKSGTTVTIKNTSSHPLQLDSDPHPAHTDNTELNVGMVDAGQSETFTVTKKGSFGFHNHLNPSDTGTLVVQ